MPMKNPPHPGRSIKDACLEPLELSVTEGAKVLGVTRHTLSRVINGQSEISPDMAIRLEKAGWSNADHWLRLQTAYELAQARKHQDQIQVERYEPRPAAQRGLREGSACKRQAQDADCKATGPRVESAGEVPCR